MSTHRDPRFPPRDQAVVPWLIERHAAERPDRVFAVFADEEWSWRDLARKTWRRANGLIAQGVRPGDTVSSWLPTGKAAIQAWFGINAAGATYAPLNLAYKGRILEHTLNLAESKVLVAHADLVERLEGLDLHHLEKVIVVGSKMPEKSRYELVPWDAVESDDASRPATVDGLEVWDDMALIYTSGTTGPSKGVRCSYLHHFTFAENNIAPEIGTDDRFFVCVPMFHASGTTATYTMLQRGGSIAVTPGFDTKTYWDDVRRYHVTCAYIMAAMANFLYRQPERPDDADNPMRIAYMGPMIEDISGFSRRFGVELFTTYAMTEVPAVVRTELNPKDHRPCGKLVDPQNYEARVVDEHDQELPPGKIGELIVRHARPWSLNSGYKGMPEATARAWRNGWFHTGDALYRDEEGNFYFVDRWKDAIRRRGENVSSVEVENEILAHSSVAEAACVAVPSDVLEDEIKACVVLKEGERLSHEALIEHLTPRLPYFMVPRYVEFLDELPKTPSLKVQKFQLRERGLTDGTWDREAAGIRLRREKITEDV